MTAPIRSTLREKDRGFTLIELLVVMIILGILAAVAVPVYLNQRKKAVDASIKSDLRLVADQVETNASDTQSYPVTDWQSISGISGLSALKLTSGNNVLYKSVGGGKSFCLAGYATLGTSDADGRNGGNTNYFFYGSQDGGIVNQSAVQPIDGPTSCTADGS